MAELARPSSRSAYLLALQQVPGVGPWTAVQVESAFARPDDLFEADAAVLEEALGRRFAGRLTALQRGEWPSLLAKGEELVARHREAGMRVIAHGDDDYPPLLALYRSPPAILYVRGNTDVLRHTLCVGVIGTREPTERGRVVAARVSAILAEAGFVIVSGLARGIDQAAHEAAVGAGGLTVAVLGTAIDKVYPADAKPLAEAITSTGGALVSEYPIGLPTTGRHFVERDRIQSGMSVAVIAVQTGVKGGTLHTVRFAHEGGRAVFAPRPLDVEASHEAYGGIHELLASRRAHALESQADYPALVQFLGAYRDWILGTGQRPAWPPGQEPGDAPAEQGESDVQTDLGL